jgi:dinuclear metal center YbgI/SA1388 family protein
MPTTLADADAAISALWPQAGAESWDAVGLIAGDPADEVRAIHLAVDAVPETVDETLELGAQLLLTHHSLLLRGVTSVAEDRYKGVVLGRLIRGGSALIAAHTNADVVARGTSAVLAERLGLVDTRPLDPSTTAGSDIGLGRVGRLATPTTLGKLARLVAEILPATAQGVRVAGEYDQPVTTMALCAGAGDSLLANPRVVAADVYLTSDLRHHPASEARERARLGRGPALIDVSHWASEWLWLDVAAEQLRSALPGVAVTVSELRTDPWDFAIV